ncbi:MAG: DUF6069 family protein [Bacillota bacterium]
MSANPVSPVPSRRPVTFRQGLLAGLLTTLLNLAVWAVARYALGVSFQVPTPPAMEMGDFNPLFIVIASLPPALLAPPVYNLVRRISPNAFLVLALVILLLSFAMPFGLLAAADMATKLTLNLMHVVSAAGILWIVREGQR